MRMYGMSTDLISDLVVKFVRMLLVFQSLQML